MPRTKRCEKINGLLLQEIETQISRLEGAISKGEAGLVPFNAHYEALGALRKDLQRALNLLNARPADWERSRMPQ
jgi:hypothetical protein